MKRYSIFALALVLGCTLFTGCRRNNIMNETVPHTAPAATQAPTVPATRPTMPTVTEPATQHATEPATQRPTDVTEGSTNDSTEAATDGTAPRSRSPRPNMQ